jgi:hypothetical protein
LERQHRTERRRRRSNGSNTTATRPLRYRHAKHSQICSKYVSPQRHADHSKYDPRSPHCRPNVRSMAYLAAGVAGLGIAFKSRIFHAPASRTSVALQSPSILNGPLCPWPAMWYSPQVIAASAPSCSTRLMVISMWLTPALKRSLCRSAASKNSACGGSLRDQNPVFSKLGSDTGCILLVEGRCVAGHEAFNGFPNTRIGWFGRSRAR